MVNVRGRDCKKESHDSTLSKGYEKVNNIDQMMMKYEEMWLWGIKTNQTTQTWWIPMISI